MDFDDNYLVPDAPLKKSQRLSLRNRRLSGIQSSASSNHHEHSGESSEGLHMFSFETDFSDARDDYLQDYPILAYQVDEDNSGRDMSRHVKLPKGIDFREDLDLQRGDSRLSNLS